jgi:hypothetical protein
MREDAIRFDKTRPAVYHTPRRAMPIAWHYGPKWRNWQTRYVQGVVGATSWEFKSPLRHHHSRQPVVRSGLSACCRLPIGAMGNSLTVERLTLDQVVGVRVPVPQPCEDHDTDVGLQISCKIVADFMQDRVAEIAPYCRTTAIWCDFFVWRRIFMGCPLVSRLV